MAELGGVTYTEMAGSPIERISRDGIEVERKLKCPWSSRLILARYLVGGIIHGSLVLPDKYFPSGSVKLKNVYCADVSIEPIGKYENAFITAVYRTPNYDYEEAQQQGSTVYITESVEPAIEFITLSNEKLYWDNAQAIPVEETEVPTYLNRMIDWVYTIHGLTSIPAAAFNLVGYVNNANVYSRSLNYTFAAGTLLCGNPSLSREWSSDGIDLWQITFRFTYKPDTWNKFPRLSDNQSSLTWGVVYSENGTQKAVYPSGNFSYLII